MNKVAIVIPYMGKLPKNTKTFLLSCSYNPEIDWKIFIDQDTEYETFAPSNVTFIKSSLKQIKERIIKITKLKSINLTNGYKLCDYRPLYGQIFSDFLTGYDYWGYSDMDVVYGDLMKYIKAGIGQHVEKIGELGHLTIIRNSAIANKRYLLPISENEKRINLFKDVISQTDKICHFDEGPGLDTIYQQYQLDVYHNVDLAGDILFENLDLNSNDKRFTNKKSCYVWHAGHAYYSYHRNKNIFKHEYGYLHFQKRHFQNFISETSHLRTFSITTKGYSEMEDFSGSSITAAIANNHSPLFQRLRYTGHLYFKTNTFTNRKAFGYYLPVKYILWRIFKRRDFRI
ncbi:DUF6625 family protein [Oenococcus sp.]|uniref:DUF6625 family protein n=1 Tax=Oenococcus sp. TaxID=1979414 RepID=UPI0039E86A67